MPLDPNLQEAIDKLVQVNADDAAEDAAFEAAIAALQTQVASLTASLDTANAALATVTAERDVATARVDVLETEKATTIAFLIAQRGSIDARLTALGG